MAKHKSKRQQQYETNKKSKVGETIICPICGEHFVKKQWQQAFCCKECKETYWNAKGDRHQKGYYHEYNKRHLERLERIGIDLDDMDKYDVYDHPFSSDALGQE